MSKLDEITNHLEEIMTIENRQKQYSKVIQVNGMKKEFIIDTGSPVTIMPSDERKMGKTEIQKITNQYHDKNKNEVKFRGKIPVDI